MSGINAVLFIRFYFTNNSSSSIDTPALIWRTFDWLSISVLKAMSREALRVICCCLGLMGVNFH